MLEKVNFERFKAEYDKDPTFTGLHSLRDYQDKEHTLKSHGVSSVSTTATTATATSSATATEMGTDRISHVERGHKHHALLNDEKSTKYLSLPAQSSGKCFPSKETHPSHSVSYSAQVQEEATRKKRAYQVKVGWMSKEGHIFKSWSERWFVLNKGVLRYYKSAFESFIWLKGEINLGDYYTIPISDTRFELRATLENGKNFLIETNKKNDCNEWLEEINFQIRYWHTDVCSSLHSEFIGLDLTNKDNSGKYRDFSPSLDEDKLQYFQKRMISTHLRQSEYNFAEAEEILHQVESNDKLTAYELVQINIYRPKVEFILARPLTLPAGAVLFTAGVGPVAYDWSPSAPTPQYVSDQHQLYHEDNDNSSHTHHRDTHIDTHRPSYLASTDPIPGCPLLLQTSEHIRVQLQASKVQIEVQLPKVLRFISLHLEDKQLFFHSLAMLSATHTENMAQRINVLAKALLAFVSPFLLLPNLSVFLNLAMRLAGVGNTDTDIIESDDISLSLETPHSCKTDCIKVYLKLNVKDVIADVFHLKKLMLYCLNGFKM